MAKSRPHIVKDFRKYICKIGGRQYLSKMDKHRYFWKAMTNANLPLEVIYLDLNIPLDLQRDIRAHIESALTIEFLEFTGIETPLNCREVMFYNLALKSSLAAFGKETKIYKDLDKKTGDIFYQFAPLRERMGILVAELIAEYTHPKQYIYTCRMRVRTDDPRKVDAVRFFIDRYESKRRSITLEGKKRTIYRADLPVGWVANLKPFATVDGNKIDLFIQGHVLNRLEERLDSLSFTAVRSAMSWSFYEPEPIEFMGKKLIPFLFEKKILGYFLCEFHNNYCLAKTFLFLTHNTTPEGEKLNRELSLTKFDKKYLQLDTLSHFTHSDIKDDPDLMEILNKCGVAHLCTLNTKFLTNAEKVKSAEFIKSMILGPERYNN